MCRAMNVGEDADETVDVRPRNAVAVEALLARQSEAERNRGGDEQVRHDSRRAGRVPVDGERREDHAATGSATERSHSSF